VTLRVAVVGELQRPQLRHIPQGSDEPAPEAIRGSREVLYAGSNEWIPAQVYDRKALLAGNIVKGPALIDEHASTTVVAPGDELFVNRHGHLIIEVGT
jgi:N-methylhydantoinase A